MIKLLTILTVIGAIVTFRTISSFLRAMGLDKVFSGFNRVQQLFGLIVLVTGVVIALS